jgi:hypothetical protein
VKFLSLSFDSLNLVAPVSPGSRLGLKSAAIFDGSGTSTVSIHKMPTASQACEEKCKKFTATSKVMFQFADKGF